MAKKTTFTKFEPRKVLAAARCVREKWVRAIEGSQNLQAAREQLRMAEAASETRSREYKDAEMALLNLARGETMSAFDERGPQRVPTNTVRAR